MSELSCLTDATKWSTLPCEIASKSDEYFLVCRHFHRHGCCTYSNTVVPTPVICSKLWVPVLFIAVIPSPVNCNTVWSSTGCYCSLDPQLWQLLDGVWITYRVCDRQQIYFPVFAGTRGLVHRGMARLSWPGGWLHSGVVYPPADSHPSQYWPGPTLSRYIDWDLHIIRFCQRTSTET